MLLKYQNMKGTTTLTSGGGMVHSPPKIKTDTE